VRALPQSWCPRLVLDRYVMQAALGPTNMNIIPYHRARLETYVPHTHEAGLVTRFTEYHDTACTRPRRVTEVFLRRKDGLYKRVRCVDSQTVEQHFEKDHFGGVALVVDILGKRQELYCYAGARVDGLVKRVHEYGVKITEYYGDTPNRLWYRSMSLMATPGRPLLGTLGGRAPPADLPSSLTVEVAPPVVEEVSADDDPPAGAATAGGARKTGVGAAPLPAAAAAAAAPAGSGGGRKKLVMMPVEQGIRKMTEKYRRDPTGALPAHADMAKVMYLLGGNTIQVIFHHAAGRLPTRSRLYQKPSGSYEKLSVDPYAPVPRVRADATQ